jgi:hypothetical protein
MSRLEDLILAPDRERCPPAREILSLRGDEDAHWRRRAERIRTAEFEVSRRGQWHGEYLEFEPELTGLAPEHRRPDPRRLHERWQSASPILLPSALTALLEREAHAIHGALSWFGELSEPSGLRRGLDRALEDPQSPWEVRTERAALFDSERDIERVWLAPRNTRRRTRLWIKSGWLSTHPDDASLRVRVSCGEEGRDDATADLEAHRRVAELASATLPCAAALRAEASLRHRIESLSGEPLLFTQDIAYWNAPEGGALFHHDAFAEDGSLGQLGVCYAQLAGETFWLALSTQALMLRIREFTEALEEGALPWLRAQLWPEPAAWKRHLRRLEDEQALRRELALPGQGELGPLVNRGPEFSAFLADAGHGWLLRAGDAILLPNHGLERTCMHSVFCPSEEPTYALSLAIRSDREEETATGGD